MTDYNNPEWSKKLSALYNNLFPRQMDIANKLKNNYGIPNFDWTEKLHKNILINPLGELIKVTTSLNSYQVAFKAIENLNSSPLKDFIDKLAFRSYDFADLIEDFDDENEEALKKDSIKSIIIESSNKIRDILFEIYLNNEKLYKLSPREFEKVIAELLYYNGFEVELTKQTRDNGFDILALKYLDNLSPIKYLVECKRYNPARKIGVEIIRSFKEVLQTEQANKGLIVTTSYFSIDAIKKQKETPYLLDYKDKDELINWVNQYYNAKR